MSKQTKLSPADKDYLRILREKQKGKLEIFHYPEFRVTVGIRYTPGNTCARVFVSIASKEETKFRRKVGELFVRNAFEDYQNFTTAAGIPYVVQEYETLEDVAETIAQTIGHV